MENFQKQYKEMKVVIVGGGLVGSLISCYFGSYGYEVDLYEYRPDIRNMEHFQGRSINLALSKRGREALKQVGLEDRILKELGTPMYGRMIHNLDGSLKPIPYGKKDQCIYSISRRILNEILLTEAEKFENVKLHFGNKLKQCDLRKKTLTFNLENGTQEEVTVKPDLVIGCDGSFSSVRRSMMQTAGFNYSQHWIDHSYIELRVPPDNEGKPKMSQLHLHIWPRGTFMLIALPNLDNSFTLTLFLPHEYFDDLSTEKNIMEFFLKYFQDVIPLIGREQLLFDVLGAKASKVVNIKSSPHHYEDFAILLGDSAHAMVPFYGQGMNCGFEDCLLFHELLEAYDHDFGKTLQEYSLSRVPDAHSIVELALYNYTEMRDHVNSFSFLVRKAIDNFVNKLFPSKWIPLYTMVTFSRIRYHECIFNKKWQDQVIKRVKKLGVFMAVMAISGVAAWRFRNNSPNFSGNFSFINRFY